MYSILKRPALFLGAVILLSTFVSSQTQVAPSNPSVTINPGWVTLGVNDKVQY